MVLYQNSFFLSHLSMLHLLARSVFLELRDVPRRAHTPAQQQGGKVGVALIESPHFHMAFRKRPVPRLSFPPKYLSAPFFCKADFLLFVSILGVSDISPSISHEIKLCLCISRGCRQVA